MQEENKKADTLEDHIKNLAKPKRAVLKFEKHPYGEGR